MDKPTETVFAYRNIAHLSTAFMGQYKTAISKARTDNITACEKEMNTLAAESVKAADEYYEEMSRLAKSVGIVVAVDHDMGVSHKVAAANEYVFMIHKKYEELTKKE